MPNPGMLTQESRGSEISVGLPAPDGMCRISIESVLVPPPSAVVPSWASSAGEAPAGRWSSPTSRMFSSDEDTVDVIAGIALTCVTPPTKCW